MVVAENTICDSRRDCGNRMLTIFSVSRYILGCNCCGAEPVRNDMISNKAPLAL